MRHSVQTEDKSDEHEPLRLAQPREHLRHQGQRYGGMSDRNAHRPTQSAAVTHGSGTSAFNRASGLLQPLAQLGHTDSVQWR